MRVIILRMYRYILLPRPWDVQQAMLIGAYSGTTVGVVIGIVHANESGHGKIWKPFFYGAFYGVCGITTGIHYRRVMMACLLLDTIRSGFFRRGR